jgi:hypothetical protein
MRSASPHLLRTESSVSDMELPSMALPSPVKLSVEHQSCACGANGIPGRPSCPSRPRRSAPSRGEYSNHHHLGGRPPHHLGMRPHQKMATTNFTRAVCLQRRNPLYPPQPPLPLAKPLSTTPPLECHQPWQVAAQHTT